MQHVLLQQGRIFSEVRNFLLFVLCRTFDSRDGVVGTVTGLWAGSSGSEPSKCYSVGIGGSLPRGTVGGT